MSDIKPKQAHIKFAVVNHQRQEPLPALSGSCPACGQPMVAKCGGIKVWHWAHRGKRHCDVWWENETEWHRAWKGKFPLHWQEIVHEADTGEKHIADVKTDRDWVIEKGKVPGTIDFTGSEGDTAPCR